MLVSQDQRPLAHLSTVIAGDILDGDGVGSFLGVDFYVLRFLELLSIDVPKSACYLLCYSTRTTSHFTMNR